MHDWMIWQIVDSAFPTGGFAHSWGLEAAWQMGEVADEGGLTRFLRDTIAQMGQASLPFVTAAHDDPARLPDLDALCDVFLTNPVANRASRAQGSACLATCARTFPSPALSALERQARSLHRHAAPVFGATMQALEVSRELTQRMWLYATARGVLAAGVRLGIVGSYAAQRMQHDCAADLDVTLERCGALAADDVAQTAPILDIVQSAHDRLYSRLFQS